MYLQLSRLVNAAGFEHRRVFQDATKALEHLAPSLAPEEKLRARAFLAGR
jgi:hypothetical protein